MLGVRREQQEQKFHLLSAKKCSAKKCWGEFPHVLLQLDLHACALTISAGPMYTRMHMLYEVGNIL